VSVYSIWESRFPAEASAEGLETTRAIWVDMGCFDGYLDHEIVQDLEDGGHLFVISEWRDREAAEAALSYRAHPNARRVDDLVSEARRRTVGTAL
jgi:quinol monooxygenase YgiN